MTADLEDILRKAQDRLRPPGSTREIDDRPSFRRKIRAAGEWIGEWIDDLTPFLCAGGLFLCSAGALICVAILIVTAVLAAR